MEPRNPVPLDMAENESLYGFQIEAARFALSRNRSYLALEPGLGKTAIAATVAQTLNASTMVICPPFLARNTEAEFKRFAPKLSCERFNWKSWTPTPMADVIIVPDTIVDRREAGACAQALHAFAAKNGRPSLIVVDEAHRFKNPKARRTQALFGQGGKLGLAGYFTKVLYLSGTPIPNSPIELFSVLDHSAPACINHMNRFEYGRHFCNAHRTAFGWDFTGASNMAELRQRVIGPFMLRMRKADVLKELPPKIEGLVILSAGLPKRLSKIDEQILKAYSPDDLVKNQIKALLNVGGDLHIATHRKEIGIHKAKAAAEYINHLLDESDEALVVFAIHKEAIEKLSGLLAAWKPLVITGQTPMAERHEIVKAFQEDRGRRLFIGNIQAAGVGLTLTKASRVVFMESSWVPSENEQASDRCHRIGQTEAVLVQHLAFKDSIDRAVLETVLRKKRITAQL